MDSDSDDDLIIASTRKRKVEISDFKKILKSSSSARRKKQDYELLSTQIVKSQKEQIKDTISEDKIITISFQELRLEKHPEFIKEEPSLHFKSGLIDAIIKTGKYGMGNLEFLEWIVKCALKFSNESWSLKILKSLGLFLSMCPLYRECLDLIFGFLGIKDSDTLKKTKGARLENSKEKEYINVIIGIFEQLSFTDFSDFKKFILFTMDYRVSKAYFPRLSTIISKYTWDNQYTDRISLFFKDFLPELNIFLGMLKHKGQEVMLRVISTRYLELYYFKEFNFQEIMKRLNLEDNLQHEIQWIYLIRYNLNSAELDQKQRSDLVSWAKSKSKFQKTLTAESITVLNFLNECRLMYSR